jgi:hypothetical protein
MSFLKSTRRDMLRYFPTAYRRRRTANLKSIRGRPSLTLGLYGMRIIAAKPLLNGYAVKVTNAVGLRQARRGTMPDGDKLHNHPTIANVDRMVGDCVAQLVMREMV